MTDPVSAILILGISYFCQFRIIEPDWALSRMGVMVCWPEHVTQPSEGVLTFLGSLPTDSP